MYGHSCRVLGRGGGGSPAVTGGFPVLGAQRDHPHPSVRRDPPGPLGPLSEAIHRPTKALVTAADGEQRVQGFGFPRAPDVGVVRVVPPGVRVGAWVVWWGGVVGGEEGVGAVYHPVVCGCVVGGSGEGVVQIVHEGHVRGGGWLLLVGSGDVPRDVVPEVAQGGHPGYPCFPLPLLGAIGGGVGWGGGHVGLMVAGAALGVHPPRHGVSDQVSPPVDGGHPDLAPRGGRALAVSGGAWGALVSGDVEEGVEEEVSDAFPQGGRLDQGGRPDGGAGAGGAEVQHDVLFPESPEVLPYRCGVV